MVDITNAFSFENLFVLGSQTSNAIVCNNAGFFPHPSDCQRFYRCVDWDGDIGRRFSVFHFTCPNGTIFDPSLSVCNYRESVYPARNCSAQSGANQVSLDSVGEYLRDSKIIV